MAAIFILTRKVTYLILFYNNAINWYAFTMELAEQIRKHYLENLSSLPDDKRFHFVSRLGSWSQDDQSKEKLLALRTTIAPPGISPDSNLQNLIAHPPQATINALGVRQPYFESYPMLRPYIFALFRTRHMLCYFNEDWRDNLLHIVSMPELQKLANDLKQDEEAIRVLSTYAINY